MYVVYNVITPTKLSMSTKKLFKELAKENLDNEEEIKKFQKFI